MTPSWLDRTTLDHLDHRRSEGVDRWSTLCFPQIDQSGPRSKVVHFHCFPMSEPLSGGLDREKGGPPGKTAGQKGWSAVPPFGGECPTDTLVHPPRQGAAS